MEVTNKAFQFYQQGLTLRELEKIFNVPRSTLSFRFKKQFGNNYADLKNSHGLLPMIKEYLHNPNLPERHRNTIKRWFNDNLSIILESEVKHRDTKLYSDKQLDNFTRFECGHRSKDWRDVFEFLNIHPN